MSLPIEEIVADLGNSDKPLLSSRLIDLSDLSSEELAFFETAWALIEPKRRQQIIRAVVVVAPLIGGEIVKGGAVLQPGRPAPIEPESHLGPGRLGPDLLLTHIMGPAAAVDALAAAQGGQVDDRAVDHVAVVPVVGAGA